MAQMQTYGYNIEFWKSFASKICDDFKYDTATYEEFELSVGGQRILNGEFPNMNTNYFYISKYLVTTNNPYLIHQTVGEEIFVAVTKWIARRIKCTLTELYNYENIKMEYTNDEVQDISIYVETKNFNKMVLGTSNAHTVSELSFPI
jgi:hypothetical protein